MRPYRLRIGNLPLYMQSKNRFCDMNVGTSGHIYNNEARDVISTKRYTVIALKRGVTCACLLEQYREELSALDSKCKATIINDLMKYNPLAHKYPADLEKCEYFLILTDDIHREYIDSKPEVVWQPYLEKSPNSHPSFPGLYICTIDKGDGSGRRVTADRWVEFGDGHFEWAVNMGKHVVAWCPLPEPWNRNLIM